MTQADESPRGDPWNAFGYVVAGVLLYGLAGYGLDRWWGTGFMVAVGIMLGAVLGLYMTWARFKAPPEPDADSGAPTSRTTSPAPQPPTSTDHPTEPPR
ncbi:AtpZ/AtpI family protein [Nocardioides sp.]|jgi:hypothetical protein|uniref:AtpZ/AtpI family protein n=1 Tax=Nocardioides sp. TaxID=35761 RepID=UPI001D1D4313|nr:AtpZ/AtpI family protein [Nocardioides sp.]MBU1801328.1 AtpZ/AtpI family protein [Actinomycetota bacterium]